MLKEPDFPVFAEHIQEVMLRAGDEETSLRQMTNIILKDLSLTLKVLRTANTAYYNRSGKQILTVTHAVALLGLEAIRDLAGGMLLLQHYHARSAGLKELMLLSLLTASHARVTAGRIRYPRREEAYLCGMFRNLGEVLVACYLPREYAAILRRMKQHGSSEHEASLRTLQCTYEDLAEAAARHWNIPDRVTQCLRAEYPRLTKAVNTEAEILEALTSFSHGLTAAIHRRDPKGIRVRLNYLLETHGLILGVGLEEIQEIAEAAIAETKSTFDQLRVPLDDLRLRKQREAAMAALEEEAEEIVTELEIPELPPGEKLLESLTQEVESLLGAESEFELTNAILMILEAMYRGVPFDRVLFGLLTPGHTVVRGRLGLGHGIDELLEQFRFTLSGRSGPVAMALGDKVDLFVSDQRFDASELVRLTGATCFGLYPVIVDGVVIGCFYFDRRSPVEPLTEPVAGLLSRLRDLAAAVIAGKRAADNG